MNHKVKTNTASIIARPLKVKKDSPAPTTLGIAGNFMRSMWPKTFEGFPIFTSTIATFAATSNKPNRKLKRLGEGKPFKANGRTRNVLHCSKTKEETKKIREQTFPACICITNQPSSSSSSSRIRLLHTHTK
jgi:hypothetical protein